MFVDPDDGQRSLLNADTGVKALITDDAGFETRAQGWQAPQCGSAVVAAFLDAGAIAVWRDLAAAHRKNERGSCGE